MDGNKAQMNIPFMRLDRQFEAIRETVTPAMTAVLESGWVLQSPEVEQLETRLAEMHGLRHCVAVNSGTDALIFAMAALNLPKGSKVAVPAMTFVASGSAVTHNGCQPVFVDVDPETLLMDQSQVLDLIRRREVAAIVVVHLYGQLAELEEIAQEARKNGVKLVEDAAQAIGATRHGKPAGQWGDVTCLSFDPTKPVGAYGSGGAVLTNNDDFAQMVRLLRYHGHVGQALYSLSGFNSQMDSIQAAIINAKLDYLEPWQRRRIEIAGRYTEGLAGLPGVKLVKALPGTVHNQHKFVMLVEERDKLQRGAMELGLQTKVQYAPALHRQQVFANVPAVYPLPNAEQAADIVLSLPMYPELTDAEADYVIESVRTASQSGS